PFVKKYLLKITLSPQLAEDLTQETMIRCIQHITSYNGKSKFSSWLITIAGRLYLDKMRKKQRWHRYVEGERHLMTLRWQAKSAGHEWSEVLEALGMLSAPVRMALVMRHYYGYTIEEISRMLEIPQGTVKSRIHNGIQ